MNVEKRQNKGINQHHHHYITQKGSYKDNIFENRGNKYFGNEDYNENDEVVWVELSFQIFKFSNYSYFPIIFLIAFSFINASIGVKVLMSIFVSSSRIFSKTGSSN